MKLHRSGWKFEQTGQMTVTGRSVVAMLVVIVAVIAGLRHDAKSAARVQMDKLASAPSGSIVSRAFGQLPLIFEQNVGQAADPVKFIARGGRYELFLTPSEAVLALENPAKRASKPASKPTLSVVRMGLANATGIAVRGVEELPGKSNYFIGNDPSQWHSNVPQFARVQYSQVYPGIDLVYYGRQGQLEYDFEVSPGTDTRQIALRVQGARTLSLRPNGDLSLMTDGGEAILQAPRLYQKSDTKAETPVAGRFDLRANNEIGFELGNYDHSRALIIDPVLSYSTYLGGSGAESCSTIIGAPVTGTTTGGVDAGTPGCPAVAVDTAQNIYLAGSSMSTDFPAPGGGHQTLLGTANVFVAKINPSASSSIAQLVFSTYVGGNGVDYTAGVAVDSGFNIEVAGTTSSSNFPTMLGYQTAPLSAGNHVFATRVNPSGALTYSTYLSGTGADLASGLAIDTSGLIYVTGTTSSSNFPTTVGAFQTAAKAPSQFFFSKINPSLTGTTSLAYSTYIGGTGTTNIGGGIAVDSAFSVYVSGGTNSTDMPVLNAYQTDQGGIDAWVAQFLFPQNNQKPPTLGYLTYFGGTGDDIAYGVAVDANFNAYITGSTTSNDITAATATTPFQAHLDCPAPLVFGTSCPTNPTAPDAFVARFGVLCSTTGCTVTTLPLTYFSYLGGTSDDIGLGIAVDTIGGARLTGWTNSSDFNILNNPANLTYGGGIDAFAARIDTTSNSTTSLSHFSTYLGGSGTDVGTSIAVDQFNNTYIAGETASINFPYDNPYQSALNGPSDVFATKLGSLADLTITETATPSPVGVGNNVTFTYSILNVGDAVTGLNFNSTLPATGATYVSSSASPGTCGGVNGGAVGCTLGTLNGGATATVTIVLAPTIAQPLGNTGTVSVAGSSLQFSPQFPASVVVNDYTLTVSPGGPVTVPAGVPATYTAQVTPTPGGTIPNQISLSCGSGLPAGATCTFSNNPIPNLNNGAQSSTLIINSVARVTTTTQLLRGGPFYALMLPLFGITFLGIGASGKKSFRRRLSSLLLVGVFLGLALFLAGCSSKASTTTTTGTPAGTYTVVVNATSGTVTRSESITYVVQ